MNDPKWLLVNIQISKYILNEIGLFFWSWIFTHIITVITRISQELADQERMSWGLNGFLMLLFSNPCLGLLSPIREGFLRRIGSHKLLIANYSSYNERFQFLFHRLIRPGQNRWKSWLFHPWIPNSPDSPGGLTLGGIKMSGNGWRLAG